MSRLSPANTSGQPINIEPFLRIPVRDNFYHKSSLFLMPFAMITKISERGTTGIGPQARPPTDRRTIPAVLRESRHLSKLP